MQEYLHEQQRRQEREAAEQLQRQEQEEHDRRRRESEEQRLAQEEARRRAMEQAEERRRSEQERRLYEERERNWQDDQRRRVDEQRRMQQQQQQQQQQQPAAQQQQLGVQDQVRSQLLTQEATMRQASEAAKLRRQQEEELERQRERERGLAARSRLEELDRKRNGGLGPASLGGDAVMRPPGVVRNAWGSADSVGGAGNVVGSVPGLQETDYASMSRGRGAVPKEPRKLYDHKTDKFVSEDEKAWKGLNRPPAADKGASKGGDKSNSASSGSSGKESRSGHQSSAAGTAGGKEHDGMSRAALKKLALEERRRREREGKTHGDDDDDLPSISETKTSEKNPAAKRLLTRDHEKGGKGGGRNAQGVGILRSDGGASMRGVSGNWLSDVSGGLGSEELAALATSTAWDLLGGGGGKSMGASLGLHDGDMGGAHECFLWLWLWLWLSVRSLAPNVVLACLNASCVRCSRRLTSRKTLKQSVVLCTDVSARVYVQVCSMLKTPTTWQQVLQTSFWRAMTSRQQVWGWRISMTTMATTALSTRLRGGRPLLVGRRGRGIRPLARLLGILTL